MISKNIYTFNLTTGALGDTSDVLIKNASTGDSLINKFSVIPCEHQDVELFIYLLQDSTKRKPPTISLNRINSMFDQIYGSINVRIMTHLDTVLVNYQTLFDTNNNNELDKDILQERTTILTFLPPTAVDRAYKLYIIDKKITKANYGPLKKIGGFSAPAAIPFRLVNRTYPAIVSTFSIPNTAKGQPTTFAEDVAHEIGHLILGLRHPFDQFTNMNQSDDLKNIMDYPEGKPTTLSKRQLRAYQVIFIENFK